jgi:Xaa-Pro aminopeptidase
MLVNSERLQARLDRDGLDGVVAAAPANVFYLTGVQPSALSQSYAIVTRDAPTAPFLVTSAATVDQALDAFPGLRGVSSYGTFHRTMMDGTVLTDEEQYLHRLVNETDISASALEALVSGLRQMGLADKRIGVDEGGPVPGLLEQLRDRLPARISPAAGLFRWVRLVKTAEELRRLRLSAAITERALIACQGVLRPGVTEIEVAREFERSIVSQGGVRRILHVRFGRNGVAGMARERYTRLEPGDSVWFDVGCTFEGYNSDLARVFSLGEPRARTKRYYDAMWAGEEAAINGARPGMTAGELFDLTLTAVRESGVPHYQRHHVGHGIGLDIYDPPLIAADVETQLETGMVINIETPYYEFGFGAVHVEDPFVVGADGNVLLTTLSRELCVIA